MIAVVGATPSGSRIRTNPVCARYRIRYSAVMRAMTSSVWWTRRLLSCRSA
jgi:hypothetical protein